MKKRVIAGLIIGGMTISMLTACGGNNTKTIDGTVNNSVTSTENGNEVEEVADVVADQSSASAKGYTFEYNGVVIEIDAEASQYTDALGEPVSYFEAASCAFEGLDKMYTYSSFEIDTYPTDDVDYVSTVIFKDDSIETPEGVRIGSSVDDVIAKYGDDYTEDIGQMIYEKDGMTLTFITTADNTVASIEYSSTVLQ